MSSDRLRKSSNSAVSIGYMKRELRNQGVEVDKDTDIAHVYNQLTSNNKNNTKPNDYLSINSPTSKLNQFARIEEGRKRNSLSSDKPMNAQGIISRNNNSVPLIAEQNVSEISTFGHTYSQIKQSSIQPIEDKHSFRDGKPCFERQGRQQIFEFGHHPSSSANSRFSGNTRLSSDQNNHNISTQSFGQRPSNIFTSKITESSTNGSFQALNNRSSQGLSKPQEGLNKRLSEGLNKSQEGLNNRLSEGLNKPHEGLNNRLLEGFNKPQEGLNNRSSEGFPNLVSDVSVQNSQNKFRNRQSDVFNLIGQEYSSPIVSYTQPGRRSSASNISGGNISFSNSIKHDGGFVTNENSSRRTSSQFFAQQGSANLRQTPPSKQMQKGSYDFKPMNQSLLDTARALSQSKRKPTSSQDKDNNSSFFGILGSRTKSAYTPMNFGGNKTQTSFLGRNNSRTQQDNSLFERLDHPMSLKNRLVIGISRIETSHVVMTMMGLLFLFFLVENVHEYITYQPELGFCDSTMRPETVEINTGKCLPCPVHAICLSGQIKCKHSFILIDKKCVINPHIEPNTILYLKSLVEYLQYVQAQYYCYDPNSSGYGENFFRPYKEHTWEALSIILNSLHNRDPLFFETQAKVREYLTSRSIREQFEISYDTSRQTYYVSTFQPSYYCRLQLIQNKKAIGGIFVLSFFVFLLYQLRVVRKFLYFFKLYKQERQQKNGEQQQRSTPTSISPASTYFINKQEQVPSFFDIQQNGSQEQQFPAQQYQYQNNMLNHPFNRY